MLCFSLFFLLSTTFFVDHVISAHNLSGGWCTGLRCYTCGLAQLSRINSNVCHTKTTRCDNGQWCVTTLQNMDGISTVERSCSKHGDSWTSTCHKWTKNERNGGRICRLCCASTMCGYNIADCDRPPHNTSIEIARAAPVECPEQRIENGEMVCSGRNGINSTCAFTCDASRDYHLHPADLTVNRCGVDATWDRPAPCCARLCPPYAKMDLTIAMDSSSKVGARNWALQKSFVRDLIQKFALGDDGARMSVFAYDVMVDYSTEIMPDHVLNNMTELLRRFDRIPYSGRVPYWRGDYGIRTGNALDRVSDHFRRSRAGIRMRSFRMRSGNRAGIRDVVLLVTDGQSDDDVSWAARRLRRAGAVIFAVHFGFDFRGYENLLDVTGDEWKIWKLEGAVGDSLARAIGHSVCGDPCA